MQCSFAQSRGSIQFDLVTRELRRDGVRIGLQPALEKLLVQLVSRAGQTVTRDDLAASLWPDGTHVDYENSLNNAIARLRRALGPCWIETVAKRGYRFRAGKVRIPRRPHPESERARKWGEHFWNRTTGPAVHRSLVYFNRAVDEDPEHAPALAGLAQAQALLGDEIVDGSAPRAALANGRIAANRALTADPDCAAALGALGLIEWRERWDWDSAERHFRAAVAIDPNCVSGHLYYAWLLQAQSRLRESMAHVLRAAELDPFAPFVGTNVAWILYSSRRYSDALKVLDDVQEVDPYYAMAHMSRGLCLQQIGRAAEAIAPLTRAVELAGEGSNYYQAALSHARAAAGYPAENCGGTSMDRSMFHLGRREYGTALDFLERAVEEASSHVAYLVVEPLFDPLRGERRFQRLARGLGLD